MTYKTQPISKVGNSNDYPITAKRTFKLTVDNSKATNDEPFFAIQVNFTGTSAVKVCVKSGFDNNEVNPVYVSYSGQFIPIFGTGYLSSGIDAHGTSHTTSAGITEVIAYGGNTVIAGN